MQKEHIYAVTRIHTEEQRLLDEQDLARLLSAQNASECYRLLADKGWGAPDIPENDPDALFTCEEKKTWSLIRELVGDLTPFRVFCCEHDFHNLKAAVKLVYSGLDRDDANRYFQQPGTVSAQAILQAAQRHDFSELPPAMAEAGRNAYDVLIHTANGQACEMILDFAALLAIDAEGKSAGSELLRFYAELRVDTANIKAAVRGCHMGKDRNFYERVIAPAGSLDSKSLIDAAEKSLEEVYAYLSSTAYADAQEALRNSLSAFECWCDNRLMERIRPQRYQYFTIEPLAAYILGREIEIAMVRLILTAKINRLDDAAVRKRWRLLYV